MTSCYHSWHTHTHCSFTFYNYIFKLLTCTENEHRVYSFIMNMYILLLEQTLKFPRALYVGLIFRVNI